jgi:hypothetical protein
MLVVLSGFSGDSMSITSLTPNTDTPQQWDFGIGSNKVQFHVAEKPIMSKMGNATLKYLT